MEIIKKRTLPTRYYVGECKICGSVVKIDEYELYKESWKNAVLQNGLHLDCTECNTSFSIKLFDVTTNDAKKFL